MLSRCGVDCQGQGARNRLYGKKTSLIFDVVCEISRSFKCLGVVNSEFVKFS